MNVHNSLRGGRTWRGPAAPTRCSATAPAPPQPCSAPGSPATTLRSASLHPERSLIWLEHARPKTIRRVDQSRQRVRKCVPRVRAAAIPASVQQVAWNGDHSFGNAVPFDCEAKLFGRRRPPREEWGRHPGHRAALPHRNPPHRAGDLRAFVALEGLGEQGGMKLTNTIDKRLHEGIVTGRAGGTTRETFVVNRDAIVVPWTIGCIDDN